MKDIYKTLEELDISYDKHEHPAVYTVETAQKYYHVIDAGHSKNLFLRNKKGDKHYLVVVKDSKQVDLKKLGIHLGETRLSFASPERLLKYLGLTPGSVSPFGLINDKNHEVSIIVDTELLVFEKIGFHPNINTATLVIKRDDFKKFLEWTGNKIMYTEV